MEELKRLLPLLIPILLIQLVLQIVALVSLAKRKKVRFNNKVIWVLIIILGEIVGPILYFSFGGEDA